MTTRARATLLLMLLGVPAAAQTQGRKAPPTRAAKPAKSAKSAEPPPPPPPPPPAPREPEPPSPTVVLADRPPHELSWRSKMHLGPTLELAMALSRSNATKSLSVLPFASLGLAIDLPLDHTFHVRLEPSIGLLRRRSTVRAVREVDASAYPKVDVTTEDITNQVTHLSLSLRALAGLDYTPTLTGRAGVVFGYGTASTSASQCSDSRAGGAVYGLHLAPIAYRHEVSTDRSVEVSLLGELRWQTIPRCDVPLGGNFQVDAGDVATFRPQIVKSTLLVGMIGLQGAFLF